MDEGWKITRRYCQNCGRIICGIRNTHGVVKLRCNYCGMEQVGKKLGRRHERCDIYVPPGEEIEN